MRNSYENAFLRWLIKDYWDMDFKWTHDDDADYDTVERLWRDEDDDYKVGAYQEWLTQRCPYA